MKNTIILTLIYIFFLFFFFEPALIATLIFAPIFFGVMWTTKKVKHLNITNLLGYDEDNPKASK